MNQPTPVHISVSKSRGISIDWSDGVRSEYELALLRHRCPCASCNGSHGAPPSKPDSPFQMYQPTLRIEKVSSVGSYALQIHWSDGHSTGIYTWDHLRNIAP